MVTLLDIFQQIPILLLLTILVVSFLVIFKSAQYMIISLKNYSQRLGLSEAFIGLFVLGTALAIPAILSSINGIFLGDPELVLGSILGANLLTIGFAVGVSGFKYKSLILKSEVLSKSMFFTWGLIVLPLLLILDGRLGRIDGAILLVLFFSYITYIWFTEKKREELKEDVSIRNLWKPALTFIIALAALLLATNWLVFSASALSNAFKIPSFFAAVTVVSLGTTLPNFAVRLQAKTEGYAALAMGTYIGKLLITFVLFFGLIGLFNPVSVQPSRLVLAAIFMLVFVTILFVAQKKANVARYAGVGFLVLYFIFIILELLKDVFKVF